MIRYLVVSFLLLSALALWSFSAEEKVTLEQLNGLSSDGISETLSDLKFDIRSFTYYESSSRSPGQVLPPGLSRSSNSLDAVCGTEGCRAFYARRVRSPKLFLNLFVFDDEIVWAARGTEVLFLTDSGSASRFNL